MSNFEIRNKFERISFGGNFQVDKQVECVIGIVGTVINLEVGT